jgi:hypothetical protein
MTAILSVAVPSIGAGWAYYRYGDTADVVGAALVGMILMGTVIATALIRKRMRR